jgi:hypothetical protein
MCCPPWTLTRYDAPARSRIRSLGQITNVASEIKRAKAAAWQ